FDEIPEEFRHPLAARKAGARKHSLQFLPPRLPIALHRRHFPTKDTPFFRARCRTLLQRYNPFAAPCALPSRPIGPNIEPLLVNRKDKTYDKKNLYSHSQIEQEASASGAPEQSYHWLGRHRSRRYCDQGRRTLPCESR